MGLWSMGLRPTGLWPTGIWRMGSGLMVGGMGMCMALWLCGPWLAMALTPYSCLWHCGRGSAVAWPDWTPNSSSFSMNSSASPPFRCTRGDALRGLSPRVVRGQWNFVRRDPRQPPGANKPGYLSLSAPSDMEIDVGAAPAGVVALGYLRSYDERMGEIHVSCLRGCACNATVLNGHQTRKSSVLAFGMVSTTKTSEACTLKLTHLVRGTSRYPLWRRPIIPSNDSKAKLIAVVVPPFSFHGDDRDMASARGFMDSH